MSSAVPVDLSAPSDQSDTIGPATATDMKAHPRPAGPPRGKMPKPIAPPIMSTTPDVNLTLGGPSGSERRVWEDHNESSSLSQVAEPETYVVAHEKPNQDLVMKAQLMLPPHAHTAREKAKSPQNFLGDRTLDVSFIGNAEVENQLAATMMDLAGHIQQQNSTRQRRLEELMSLKNLGALILKAEESKRRLQAELDVVEMAQRVEEALQKQVDVSSERLKELKRELETLSKDAEHLAAEKDRAVIAHRAEIDRLQSEHQSHQDASLAEIHRMTEDLKITRESLTEHREQSAQEIASKNIEIGVLEAEIKTAESQTEATMSAKRQLDEDVLRLERELASFEVKTSAALQRESDLAVRLEKTSNLLEKKEHELDNVQAAAKLELEDVGRKLREALAEVAELRAQLESDKTRMQFEIETLKGLGTDMDNRHADNISALEQIRRSQSREIERLTEICEKLQRTINETHEQSKKTEESYHRAMDDAQTAFQVERQEAQAKLQKIEAANADLARNLQAASHSLVQSEDEKARMREAHEQQVMAARQELETTQKNMEDALANARSELEQAIAKHSAAESVNQELSAMKPKQATLMKRIKELERELGAVNAQAGTAKQDATSAQAELAQLRAQLQTAQSALSTQTEQNTVNAASFKATETRLEAEMAALQLSLRNAADATAEAVSKKEHEISLLKKQFDSSERRREAEMSNLTAKVTTLRNEKETLSSENKRLQEERKEFQNQVVSKVEQNEKLLNDIAALRETIAKTEKAAKTNRASRTARDCGMQTDAIMSPNKAADETRLPPVRLPHGGVLSRGATWIIPADAPSARRARGPLAPDDSLESTPLLPRGESGRFSQIESLGDDGGIGDDAELLQDLLTAAAAAEDEYSEMMIQDAAQGPARPLIIPASEDSAAQYAQTDRTPKNKRSTPAGPVSCGKENKQVTRKRRQADSEDDEVLSEAGPIEPSKRQKVMKYSAEGDERSPVESPIRRGATLRFNRQLADSEPVESSPRQQSPVSTR
ncbi:hypothetical protein HDU86_003424 [Geranomyces michiganensis]|nr:hypothetical protein HDU86_003424 [Geranomyces michiganensis]